MAISTPHCSVNYHRLGGPELEVFSHGVGEGIYSNNPPFSAPPIAEADFKNLADVYSDKYDKYKNGGKNQKGAYLTARTNLMVALDDTAEYVDGQTGLNADMIILAGYTPTKTGESKAVVPAAPVADKVSRGAKGVIEALCKAVVGADYYGAFILDKPWDGTLIFFDGQIMLNGYNGTLRHVVTKGRKKIISNLQSKSEYWVYFYAGNVAGVSQLSVGVSEVCG